MLFYKAMPGKAVEGLRWNTNLKMERSRYGPIKISETAHFNSCRIHYPMCACRRMGAGEAVVGPIKPGAYRYRFTVDQVEIMDPRNPSVSESNSNAWSLVYMPGAEFMDTLRVPHGAVAAVYYYSTALGRYRRMHIYTPPGYEIDQKNIRCSILCTALWTATIPGAASAGPASSWIIL
jgi:hypothetical protein